MTTVKRLTAVVLILTAIFATSSVRSASPKLRRSATSIPQTPIAIETPLGTIPAPLRTQTLAPLSAIEQLGKDLFFDTTLSNPPGFACATCHAPGAGFTGSSSAINEASGPMPGVVRGRFGKRKPQAVPYATFSPEGPYYDNNLQTWLGGNFWDGRAPSTAAQARMPFLDADEMANIPIGPYPPHSGGYSPLVAEKVKHRPYSPLFRKVFGVDIFWDCSDPDIYEKIVSAIAAYEASAEVSPFSSKYDASSYGVPAMNRYHLTPSEQRGLNLFFGKAQCSACHSSATLEPVLTATGGKDTFTMYCYANIGVPRNPKNPFYTETNGHSNPFGYNPFGGSYIDYGLGANPNPTPGGTHFMKAFPGDLAQFRGLFKAPSIRNVDKRPNGNFVKAYMHNGVFKSLEEVVNFYNKRNIAVSKTGHEVAFDLRVGPPHGYTRLIAPPEVLDNVQNVAGVPPSAATSAVASNGQIGNLGLTPREVTDLVNFLGTLSDGFIR